MFTKSTSLLLRRTVKQSFGHLTASVSDDQVASFLQLDGEQEGPRSDPAVLRRTMALITRLILQLHVNTHDMLLLLSAPWPLKCNDNKKLLSLSSVPSPRI